MKIFLILCSALAIIISNYNYDSINEMNIWRNNFSMNDDIKTAVESVYLASMLRNHIPLSVDLPSDALVSIFSLTFDLLTDQDVLLMANIFDPTSKNKESQKKSSTNVFDILLHILIDNVVDKIHLNEASLSKFRSIFEEKYIFKFYNTKFIHISVNQQAFQLTLPEYIYFGIYVYIRDKPIEATSDKKSKCIIKTSGICKYQS